MKIRFVELEGAFDFVSFGGYGTNAAYLDRSTGEIYYHSDDAESDEIPDELWESRDMIEIPHTNDLGLGIELVFDFVYDRVPEDYSRIQGFFSRPGAYGNFKDFLDERGLLDDWYQYEREALGKAIRLWCEDNDIELVLPEDEPDR